MIDNDNYNEIRKNMESTKFDPKSRYYDVGNIEVQDIIKAKLTPEQYEGFCLGNILKYSARANWKGKFDRDIEKVGFYQKFLSEAYADRMNRRNPVPTNNQQTNPETLIESLYRPPASRTPFGFCADPEDDIGRGE